MLDEIRILSPTAILGYGFPEASFQEGLRRDPHVVAVDAGSSDPGPFYLGAGVSFTDRSAVKRDLQIILPAAITRGIPTIIGSAAGARPHLDWTADIVCEIANLRFAIIDSEIEKDVVAAALEEGRISSCGGSPELTEDDIRSSTHIVAQLGFEPIVRALRMDTNVILAGRAYDPTVFAAYAVKLEGSRRVGHRFVSVAGARDPVFIAQADANIDAVRDRVADNFHGVTSDDYTLLFRLYGRDGVLGPIETLREVTPHEVGIIIDAVTETTKLTESICGFARSTMLHLGYPDRISTAGNLAFLYSPSDFDAGEVFVFSIYHLMKIDDPIALFPTVIENIGNGNGAHK